MKGCSRKNVNKNSSALKSDKLSVDRGKVNLELGVKLCCKFLGPVHMIPGHLIAKGHSLTPGSILPRCMV